MINACGTEGLGKKLRDAGVPHVVCWRSEVYDSSASAFTRDFYASFEENKNYKISFRQASARFGSGEDAETNLHTKRPMLTGLQSRVKYLHPNAVDYVCLLSKDGDEFPNTGHIQCRVGKEGDNEPPSPMSVQKNVASVQPSGGPKTLVSRQVDLSTFDLNKVGLGLIFVKPDGQPDVVVKRVKEGGAAAATGKLSPGDRVMQIDGEELLQVTAGVLTNLCMGHEGSIANLKVRKSDGTMEYVSVTRGSAETSLVFLVDGGESRGTTPGTKIDEPESLCCPITEEMFRDPVMVPESGNTYEFSTLEKCWKGTKKAKDPLSNEELKSTEVITDRKNRREGDRNKRREVDWNLDGWELRRLY